MACNHSNPANHRYCVVCGESLKRQFCACCGATCDAVYLFCYACGHNLRAGLTESRDDHAVLVPQTYDLDALMQVPASYAVKIDKVSGKMTQEQIKQLIADRQSKK